MNSNLIHVDDATFAHEVENATGLVLVDFWAEWCAPCRAVAPVLERLAAEYDGRVRFAKLNVDAAPTTATAYGIRSIPTLALFRDGKPVSAIAGAVPQAMLANLIDEQLEPAA
jgi:thioredoxin 1